MRTFSLFSVVQILALITMSASPAAIILSFPHHAHADATVIFLTTTGAGSWTVPNDWNSSNNTIEVIGGGGGGTSAGGAGGGGGAYSAITNLSLTPGGSASYSVGAGDGTGNGGAGGDTWFNGASCGAASVCAKGGNGASGTTAGTGGAAGSGVGTTKYSGGDGGAGSTAGAGGGGGAAGPQGSGAAGGAGSSSGGGGGGGGANSGTSGSNGGTDGGAGGNGRGGSGGGSAGTGAGNGGNGSNGGGGGGGDWCGGQPCSAGGGGDGGKDQMWTQTSDSATAGPGGGGGGGGYGASEFGTGGGGSGATGAANTYGSGGGGGGVDGGVDGMPGLGAAGRQGIIVITYTPAAGGAQTTLSKPPNNLGLIGYWSFDEGSGTSATDFSGRGHIGTLSGNATWVNGKRGTALALDGGDDYVTIAHAADLNPSSVTVCTWARQTGAGDGQAYQALVGKQEWDSNGYLLVYEAPDSSSDQTHIKWRVLGAGSGNAFDITAAITTTQWHHFCGVFSSATGISQLYVDGVLANSVSSATMGTSGTVDVLIGTDAINTGDFQGYVDEVRIYNRALGASEIAALFHSGAARFTTSSVALQRGSSLANGLVGHWTFDGPDVTVSGNTMTATDRSGNGNDATQNDNYPARSIGRLGQGLTFDGADEYLVLPDMGTVESYPFSFAAWFRTYSSTDQTQTIVNQENTGDTTQRVQLYYPGSLNTLCWNVRNGGSEAEPCATVAQDGTWHHAVGVSSSATDHRLYIDGVLANSSSNNVPATTVNAASIGNWRAQSGYEWNGTIDDVRIYNRALSASEVKQLYTLGMATIRN